MPPVLVAAELEFSGGPALRLTFERAIDVAGLEPSQVTVNDGGAGGTGLAYEAGAVDDTPTPESVVLLLAEDGLAAPGATTMTAAGGAGIVAAAGGAAWAGVTGLALPWP